MTRFLSDTYGVQSELKFCGSKYGWALEYRKGGRALVSMFPGHGTFIVQIVLGKAVVDLVQGMDLGKNVLEVFSKARQLHDGRWLYVRIKSKRDLEDIKRLIAAKVESKRPR